MPLPLPAPDANLKSLPVGPFGPAPTNPGWAAALFDSRAARKGGILRRAVRDVDREIGRAAFLDEVRKRGFHCLECAGQFIIICNAGQIRIVC
ncbi:hypothetical protein E7811_11980 [Aliigemmobacter aestuarii]|uniref:N-(5'-phosphoribosyl)anthranilate isomerase n=1 Tax=Aliigemmobacter aestuarii TaxID=1445661 RepID=A0A4S3MP01_9RHOB|nr:hypothetical protein [Gemmobacter aestuarii]THD82869.1 hypothetical protein E7811_11980 [Gemmobacter aestuarii]